MEGVVTLLKPPGMTSSNGVYDVRRIFGEKSAGHLGTLDPGAAGVLPVCLGRATRLFDYLVDKEKTYVFEIAFGLTTDTLDAYGRVTETGEAAVSEQALADVLAQFVGTQMQTAPIYSALKVGGRKMYDLARAGEYVEPRQREIAIHSLRILERTAENRYLLETVCSRGTYIRTLCADIAKGLGTVAYMSFLLRSASGPFRLERAWTVTEMEERKAAGRLSETLMSCEEALAFLPALVLPPDRLKAAKNALETHVADAQDGNVRLYCEGFLGVGRVDQHRVKLAVHLY